MSDIRKIECPVCERVVLKPTFPPPIRVIPWGDCACSDDNLCMFHRLSDDPVPQRPFDEVLKEKAAKRHERELADYAEMVEAFERAKQMQEEIERLKTENERLRAAALFFEEKR